MSRPTIIYCPQCHEPCGKQYPDYPPSFSDPGEPGYAEGKGEDFSLGGLWHCSEECRQQSVIDQYDGNICEFLGCEAEGHYLSPANVWTCEAHR